MLKKLLLFVLFAAVAFGGYWLIATDEKALELVQRKISVLITEEEAIEVKVKVLEEGYFDESITFKGVIFPEKNTPLYTDTPTVIKSIFVKEGSEVAKGEELLEFSDSVRDNLKRELEVVELDIRNRKLELDNLRSGSIKLELDERYLERVTLEEEIKSLDRDIKLVTFEAETLGKQSEAMEELLRKKGISSIDANEARALADRKQNELEDLKTNLEITNQRYNLSVVSYQRLRRELSLNQSNIRGEYQKLLLQKTDIERKLEEVTEPLKAPLSGVITEIFVNEGAAVPQGGKLLSLSSGEGYIIKLDIPLYQSKWVALGQKAAITTRGAEKRDYTGEVSSIAKIAKIKENQSGENRVVEIEVLVEDPEGMEPGYVADIEFKIKHKGNINVINAFSVIEEKGVSYVYVLSDDLAKKTKVDIGLKTATQCEILNLPLGTEIVVNPFKVKDGQQVIVAR